MTFLETYFDVYYILSVVLLTQVLNSYVTAFKKIDSRWTALIVSATVFIVFYWLGDPTDEPKFAIRLFLSFLASVAFYDFMLKPILDFIKKSLGNFGSELEKSDEDDSQDS